MSKEALRDKECCGERDLSLPNDIARFEKAGLLSAILYDRTTGENIIWATSAYAHLGEGFAAKDPIAIDGITGEHANNIRRRAQKDKDERTALTRAHAEVFMIRAIKEAGLEYIDKRENGGSLWIVGGREIAPKVQGLQKKGAAFKYKEGGGKATKGRDAWWVK